MGLVADPRLFMTLVGLNERISEAVQGKALQRELDVARFKSLWATEFAASVADLMPLKPGGSVCLMPCRSSAPLVGRENHRLNCVGHFEGHLGARSNPKFLRVIQVSDSEARLEIGFPKAVAWAVCGCTEYAGQAL